MAKQKQTPYKPCDLKTPSKPVPRLPAVCEKNVFRFFRDSQRKTTLRLSGWLSPPFREVKYDMVFPKVRIQSRVPDFEEKSLMVIGFKTNDLDVFKVHVVTEMVDMACNFGVLVKTSHCHFVLRNSVV